MILLARAAAAHEINGRVVSQTNQESALLPRAAKQIRLAGNLDENLLKQVARILLVPRKIQEKREQSLGVVIVQPLKLRITRHRFCLNDAPRFPICLNNLTATASVVASR